MSMSMSTCISSSVSLGKKYHSLETEKICHDGLWGEVGLFFFCILGQPNCPQGDDTTSWNCPTCLWINSLNKRVACRQYGGMVRSELCNGCKLAYPLDQSFSFKISSN